MTQRCVLVTRPQPQADSAVASLRERGLQAVALPLLAIDAAPQPSQLLMAWANLQRYTLAVFVSPNAVAHFFAARLRTAQWPPRLRAAATGPGTVAALHMAGVAPGQCVAPSGPQFDSEALWEKLRSHNWRGAQVLIVRGNGGRDELAEQLTQAGAQVEFVQAYMRVAPRWTAAQVADAREALRRPEAHVWHFSSAESTQHLPTMLPGTDWSQSSALVSHRRIGKAVKALGFAQVQEIDVSIDALAQAARG